jgi:hypothetical protein
LAGCGLAAGAVVGSAVTLMRIERGHAALVESERLYDDINTSEGRSNLDIEKHLRRSEVKAAQARAWLALARELGSQGDRYGYPGT